jgi:hypothetical protein
LKGKGIVLHAFSAHPERWRDRPYEASATTHTVEGANSGRRLTGANWKMRDAIVKLFYLSFPERFFN